MKKGTVPMVSSELKPILALITEGNQLGEQGRHEEARRLFLEAYRQCQRLGVRSTQLLCLLAVCHDYLGEVEKALVFIREHQCLDQLSLAGLKSQGIIAGHAREALSDPGRAADAADTPRLYRLLVEIGEADIGSHLAMARHDTHAGRHAQALLLLEAVVTLAPTSEEAWQAMVTAAKASGRRDLLQRATAALVGLGKGSAFPFISTPRADA